MQLTVEISAGELADKLSILELKLERITDLHKLANIRAEFAALTAVWDAIPATLKSAQVLTTQRALKETNGKLWLIEDNIRELERRKDFGPAFIDLARSVYITNDERARLKKQLDSLMGSRLSEEKSYQAY